MTRFRVVVEDPWDGGDPLPATEAQTDYIVKLCGYLDVDYEDYTPGSVQEGSDIINELKGELGWE